MNTSQSSASWNPETIASLISQGKSERLHWFPEGISVSNLATTLVGMANSRGGNLIIGISPRSGAIQGVTDIDRGRDQIFQAALSCDPPLVLPLPQVIEFQSERLLVVCIPPGLPQVYSLEGRYFGRQGTQTNPLTGRSLRSLLMERGAIQFEDQVPAQATFDDLEPSKIEEYLRVTLLLGGSAQEVLLRRGCIKELDGQLRPTYAGLLLFGRQPQQWVPSASILAARFTGVTITDQYIKQDIGGTIPDQLRKAEIFGRENIRSVVRLVGLAHEETPEYPPEAVRELLVNAVAHRDYNLRGDNIHLNIFADRIEIHSPGGLPGPVTLENLLEVRFSRNAVMAQVLSDLGYIERLGYGLNRVVEEMRQNGLPPPSFEDTPGTFKATLYGEATVGQPVIDLSSYSHLELNPRQGAALSYLSRHKRITNRDYQTLCPEVHPETLRRDLAALVSKGVLIKVGDRRATYYILK
ncbi:MAG: ATP-binding protein [Anaerolineales bacterium]|jgi:ATP-dependent DNA helicase RecG